MSGLVVVGSVRGAPGVTTTSLLIAGGVEDAVLVEADVAGGVLAARYGLGREPGLTTFAAASPEVDWRSHAQAASGLAVMVGPDSPDAAEALWRGAGRRLGSALAGCDAGLVVADLGRLRASSPLVAHVDLLVLVARPSIEHLVTLSHQVSRLRRTPCPRLGIVLVGQGPYRPGEVADALQVEILGELPNDQPAAEALSGERSSGWARSRLARAAVALADTVVRAVPACRIVDQRQGVAP